MRQFNFPTVLLYGEGALLECSKRLKPLGFLKPLVVTDNTLVKLGLVEKVVSAFKSEGIDSIVFSNPYPNPNQVD